ncbi:hypothetical protein GR160_00830 [Flavobacterium sp. Sd200]|uniref:hypothetical protein n=1 Tax=Flavobacterium sp. Sd200 TaxID=2692211 RepID=UPI0013684476|nr:hypothetical protein [Flavobacterium sp. Sd200]MXN89759.1 hypothetical protein [Flavobacterium sp. Sd200]
MKIFSLIVSVATFMVTFYFLVSDFPDITTFDGSIYLGLMIILLLICITGIIINKPVVAKARRKILAKKQSKLRLVKHQSYI